MDLWIILLTIVVGICILLFNKLGNLLSSYGYFEKRGIPHQKRMRDLGNMIAMFMKKKPVTDVLKELYEIHPDAKYVGVYEFGTPNILVRDPELIKSIGIKNFDSFPNHKIFLNPSEDPLFGKNLFSLHDDVWKSMRTLLSPAFTSSKMKMMFKTLSKCAVDFADHLAELNPQPEELDMKDIFGRYTLDVIASAAFGISVDSMKDSDNEFYRLGKSVANFSVSKMLRITIVKFCPWLSIFIDARFVDKKKAAFFTNIIKTTIETREAQGIVRPDMIHLMMQANKDRKEETALSIEDMTAQAFIFLLGGFESPATTMSFAAQLLAIHPDAQRKLQAEIDEELEKNSGDISYEDLNAMKYLDCVVNETLRMFPPAVVLDRSVSKSFTLPPALPGLEPVEIKPGQNIAIPLYSIHHDPRYFPDPEKFDPERFSEDNFSKISPMTYLPFGLGPRICIANRFALMEVKLVLFHLFSKCNLLPTSKTQYPIKLSPESFFLMPESGFRLKVEPRKLSAW